jgi:hypothetical protein
MRSLRVDPQGIQIPLRGLLTQPEGLSFNIFKVGLHPTK